LRRILVNPYRNDFEPTRFSQAIKSEMEYKLDFSNTATARGSAVSGVTVESKGSRKLTLTTPTVSSNVASFYVSADNSGNGVVEAEATFADGKQERAYITVIAQDPQYRI
jgi:hypothetical protein|tara:strand:- start:12 stop:341 length:330 start_codon:yes stop_codon:yes gene_type:complete